MTFLNIQAGPFEFRARLESELAPKTCARFQELLPFENQTIHSRWSGEAVWIPLGDFDMQLSFENHTCHPSRGDILLYPGDRKTSRLSDAWCCGKGRKISSFPQLDRFWFYPGGQPPVRRKYLISG
jgi:hypothetical protein